MENVMKVEDIRKYYDEQIDLILEKYEEYEE